MDAAKLETVAYINDLCNSYTMGISVALGHVHIYQAKHKCPWYN